MWAAEKILELVLSSTSTCISVYFTRSQPSGEIPNSWRREEGGGDGAEVLALPIRTWHSSAAQEGPRAQPLREIPAALPGPTNLPFASSTKPRGLQLAPKVGRARQLGLRTGHPPRTAHTARVLPPQGPLSACWGLLAPPRQPDTHVLVLGAPGVLPQPSFRYERGQALVRTARLTRGFGGRLGHSSRGLHAPRWRRPGPGWLLSRCCPHPPKPRRLAFAVPAPTLSGCEITKKVGRKGREKGTARRE